jgi:hypothetical protein
VGSLAIRGENDISRWVCFTLYFKLINVIGATYFKNCIFCHFGYHRFTFYKTSVLSVIVRFPTNLLCFGVMIVEEEIG